jgi:hypothetical protein
MAEKSLHTTDDLPVDALELRDAIVGNGTLLVPAQGHSVHLYATRGGRASYLGTFGDPGAAWAALDALDLAA